MARADSTCWSVVQGASHGEKRQIDRFIRLYGPSVREYVAGRWRGTPLEGVVEDAVQEVFVECFKEGGVLERATPERLGSFRAYLLGVTRNVARRAEERRANRLEVQAPTLFEADAIEAAEERCSRLFDRAWARMILRQALDRLVEEAGTAGADARRRVELLRLRFQEDLPIREIARRWGVEARFVYREYARARREFEAALRKTIAHHHAGQDAVEEEIHHLVALLGGGGR